MQKIVLLVTFAAVATWASSFAPQQEQVIENDTSRFMQRKLDYSREVVAGLTNEDYSQISNAAQNLMLLSQESAWQVATTPEYLKASSDFRETVARLRESGKEKNLDGATIAYFEVTLSCVRCHRQLRKRAFESTNPELPNSRK